MNGPTPIAADDLQQLRDLGIAIQGAPEPQPVCEVCYDVLPALEVFDRIAAQQLWRLALGMGAAVYLGVDWLQVRALAELTGTAMTPQLAEDLQVMGAEAARLLNKAAARG